jgi:hypothetical protein
MYRRNDANSLLSISAEGVMTMMFYWMIPVTPKALVMFRRTMKALIRGLQGDDSDVREHRTNVGASGNL